MKIKNIFFVLIIFAFLLFFSILTFYSGYFISPDGLGFIGWSDLLLNDYSQYFNQEGKKGQVSIFYFTTVLIISSLRYFFESDWFFFFISINLSIYFFIYFLIIYSLYRIHYNFFIFLIITILFFTNFEQYLWVKFILSDYIHYFLSSCFIFFFLNFKNIDNSKKNIFIACIILILAVFTRPIFPVYFIFLLSFLFLQYLPYKIHKFDSWTINIILLFFFTLLIIFNIGFLFIKNYNFLNIGYLEHIYNLFLNGIVINDRPHTYLSFIELNFINMMIIELVRFFYYFVFWDQLYSLKHNILNSLTFTVMYFFALLAIIRINTFLIYDRKNIIFLFLFILTFAFFHSITWIEYDWRYRLPIYFPLFLLDLYGFLYLFKKITFIKNL